jgi:hypothetical protein
MADPRLPDYDAKHAEGAVRSNDGSEDGDFSSIDPHSGVKRGLQTRHVRRKIDISIASS